MQSQTPKIEVPQGVTEVVGFVGWMWVGWRLNSSPPRLPDPLLHLGEKPALLTWKSLRMCHAPPQYPHLLFIQTLDSGSIWFLMSQHSSLGPSPGSRVVTLHLLLSSNGAKWPIRNGFHHVHVQECYAVWRDAIGCDSSCQSLLFPRQVLLNLTWWVEYTASGWVTLMWHNINTEFYRCICVVIVIAYLSAMAD